MFVIVRKTAEIADVAVSNLIKPYARELFPHTHG